MVHMQFHECVQYALLLHWMKHSISHSRVVCLTYEHSEVATLRPFYSWSEKFFKEGKLEVLKLRGILLNTCSTRDINFLGGLYNIPRVCKLTNLTIMIASLSSSSSLVKNKLENILECSTCFWYLIFRQPYDFFDNSMVSISIKRDGWSLFPTHSHFGINRINFRTHRISI